MLRSLATLLAATVLVGCQQREAPRRAETPAPAIPTASPLDQDNLPVDAESAKPNASPQNTPPHNPTAQEENQPDANMAAEIRSRLDSGNLSVNARNVKVLMQDGRLILRGPVNNAGEKEEVERIVRAYAGNNFVSELEVIQEQ